MAIISQSAVTTRTGVTYTGTDATAIAQSCTDVDAALKKMLAPYYPEPETLTFYLDAPYSRELILPYRPVRSITSIHYHPGANGDPSLFTADDLLTAYEDYQFETDALTSRNDRGIVRRVGTVWGWDWWSPPERLGYRLEPERGSLKVVAACGPAAVPADIALAACKAVLLLYQFRATGIPQGSESWNGYNLSYSQPFTAEAALRSPDVLALLAPYTSLSGYSFHVG